MKKPITKISSADPQRYAGEPERVVRKTPASAMAKSSSGKARNMSINRLMKRVDPAAEEAGDDAEDGADEHRDEGGEERDQQRDPRAVDDPAEDVAPVHRLQTHRVLPAHSPERADGDAADVHVEEVFVPLVRVDHR